MNKDDVIAITNKAIREIKIAKSKGLSFQRWKATVSDNDIKTLLIEREPMMIDAYTNIEPTFIQVIQ